MVSEPLLTTLFRIFSAPPRDALGVPWRLYNLGLTLELSALIVICSVPPLHGSMLWGM